MAYNYLGLVNDINDRVNEAQLTSANFSTAAGFYSQHKQAVNAAIDYINQVEFNWPFNYALLDTTMVAGTARYSYPSTAKTVNFNTFRIKRDATIGNKSYKLPVVDYEEYLQFAIDDEHNTTNTGIRALPKFVSRAPNLEYCVWPVPDEAYPYQVEYYDVPTPLSSATSTPAMPAIWRYVIVDGAMYYVNLFRGDIEAADRLLQIFDDRIDDMKNIYINRHTEVRDTRILKFNKNRYAAEVEN